MPDSKPSTTRTAVVIMDYQYGILKNYEAELPALLANATKVLTAARAAKIPVHHVRVAFRERHPEVSLNNFAFGSMKGSDRMILGTRDAEIHPEVAVLPGETLITKHRVGALSETDLPTLLRAGSVDHLILLGVATGGCVLSTVRLAADLDYRITVIEDACSDSSPEVHSVLMTKVFPRQATVVKTDAFIASLGT